MSAPSHPVPGRAPPAAAPGPGVEDLGLRLHLLGPPRWRLPDGTVQAITPLDAALLALLALDGPLARDTLAGRLWPDATRQHAHDNLRQRIARMRRRTGHRIVETGLTMSMLPTLFVDVHALSDQPDDVLLDAELLAGCDYGANEFLTHWLNDRRAALRLTRADIVAGRAEALGQRDALAAAIRLAERTVQWAPLHEHALRRLMRLHYLRGDASAAIAAFERFEHALREESGGRPGAETLDLLATIERQAAHSPPAVKVLPVSLLRPPQLIGRAAEWAAMEHAWSGARAYVLSGEAGSGKSRLLTAFLQGRVGVVREPARPGDAQTPLDLLARLLRAACAASPPPAGYVRSELARLLPEWGPAPAVPTDEARLRHAVEAALRLAVEGQGLTALVVDDLHFADVASLQVLRWLGASPHLGQLRFGYAMRPQDAPAITSFVRDWLDDSARPERVELTPFDEAGVRALLDSLALPGAHDDGLARRLHAHAGGNVLFVLETLKDMWLRGQALQPGPLPHPLSVRTLIERRLTDLPDHATALMGLAAVAGADFTAARATALSGLPPPALAAAWRTLELAGVMQGTAFAHDLVAECALDTVPQALRAFWHAQLAALLADDEQVAPARVAHHWQAGQQWQQAGIWWRKAAGRARQTGLLAEQQVLVEKAAACFRQANDADAEFEALYSGFEGLQIRQGGMAVLGALPRLQALARTDDARLQCLLVETEALLELERADEALRVIDDAQPWARSQGPLAADALCLRSIALGQLGRADEALRAARGAATLASDATALAQELRAVRALAYVQFQAGHVTDSLAAHLRLIELAGRLGDAPDTATAHASTAGLLAAMGDTPASLAHARQARCLFDEMGMARNSTNGATNLCTLGRTAAHLGHFAEALDALTCATEMAGEGAAVSMQAKARIELGLVRLHLGDPAAAMRLAEHVPPAAPPGLRMQAAALLAQAEQAMGGTGSRYLQRLGRLASAHPDPPWWQSSWIEWSYQGDPRLVAERLEEIARRFRGMGLAGTARSLELRRVERLLELADAGAGETAFMLAQALLPHVETGLHASSYLPRAWDVLARAFASAGDENTAAECRRRARAWIRDAALPNVPASEREGFLVRNPVNRALLSG